MAATAKKTGARGSAKKSASRKTSAAKKSASRKSPGTKKSAPRKAAGAKKSGGRKAAGSGRRYSPAAGEQVQTEMHEMHEGTLRSGRSGKKITNPKQAIAIGLSEARRSGKKVPPNSNAAGGSKKRS